MGKHSQFDIEHIIPFSRSLDNSFVNKTLCYHEENRDVKQNQTPYEAYAANETKWQEIIGRVKRFRGPAAHAKLRKFQQKKLDEDFAARMLQDTRYMSRLATEYLGLLYGGQIDADGTPARSGQRRPDHRLSPRRVGTERHSGRRRRRTRRTAATIATTPSMPRSSP